MGINYLHICLIRVFTLFFMGLLVRKTNDCYSNRNFDNNYGNFMDVVS
jgi:hypothetical protein